MTANRAQISGVLIEGVDFVGKTTAAIAVDALLRRSGVFKNVKFGQCYLSGVPVVSFLEAEAKQHNEMEKRDWFYTSAILADLAIVRSEPQTFYVQDRHWLTQLGRNRFFSPGKRFFDDHILERDHVVFSHNVLLTSDINTKISRARGREKKSPRDRLLAEHPDLNQRYEEFLRELLPVDERWKIIDTTALSAEETAMQIAAFSTDERAR